MPPTGNTTVPTPEDPSSSPPSSLSERVVPALFLCWSAHDAHRIGEVALFDPRARAPFTLGREDPGDPARVHFFQLRPGESHDGGALTGKNISREQLRITVEDDALRVLVTGKASVLVDGTSVPCGTSVVLRPGAVVEVRGNCVLLAGHSPLSLPPPPPRFSPLHAYGEADRVGLVGESARMHRLREDVASAAAAGLHVFVHGPTGTGKERVARAIHDLSPRSAGPYKAMNFGNLTAELAALELFGSPKNYPNSGTPERIGYFGTASGGTLFLDEIGEVHPALHIPLLRALDGTYNRVGDPLSRPTQCIVVAATNRDPDAIKFDVLYRLGVTVETPSLAERREDIPLLVRAELLRRADANAALEKAFVQEEPGGRRYARVDASLIVGLLRAPLRGNVRELHNILTAALSPPERSGPPRWPSRLTMPPPPPPAPAPASRVPPPPPSAPSADDLLTGIRAERTPTEREIRRAIEESGGVLEPAARALGISIHQLFRLRKKHGLLPSE
ncbi:MAG TPA: sigma 54-interacting transcriptional regulator [Polyangiaceae bacterium]